MLSLSSLQLSPSIASASSDAKVLRRPEDFELLRILRESIYGRVWLAEAKAGPCRRVAVKISAPRSQELTCLEDPAEETRILRLVNQHISSLSPRVVSSPALEGAKPAAVCGHPNVLRLIAEFTSDNGSRWQVSELCEGGELFDVLASSSGGLGEERARKYMQQLVSGVRHIHSASICHLDLSLENTLLASDDSVRIIDFGMARCVHTATNGVEQLFPATADKPGKLAYMAPEIFAGGAPFSGTQADVYSLGVMLFMMLFGVPPYKVPAAHADKRFDMIQKGQMRLLLDKWGLLHTVSDDALDLVQRMLWPAHLRPSLADIATHPWLQLSSTTNSHDAHSNLPS